jgi:hypothetical protein
MPDALEALLRITEPLCVLANRSGRVRAHRSRPQASRGATSGIVSSTPELNLLRNLAASESAARIGPKQAHVNLIQGLPEPAHSLTKDSCCLQRTNLTVIAGGVT